MSCVGSKLPSKYLFGMPQCDGHLKSRSYESLLPNCSLPLDPGDRTPTPWGVPVGDTSNRCKMHRSIKGISQGIIAPGNQVMYREDLKQACAIATVLHQVIDTPCSASLAAQAENGTCH